MNSITPDTTPQEWNPTQKRTFIVAAFSIVVGLFSFATAPYILSAMGDELGFTLENANILRIAPPAASLLAVFIAGTLGDVFGSKKVLLGGGVLYCIGVAIVLASQSFALLLAGRALEGIGSMLLRVVSLALVAAVFTSPVQRAIAFSGFAAVSPVTQILAPSIASPLAGLTGWRSVVGIWLALGLLFILTTWKLLPRDADNNQKTEFATPILAGLALVLLSSAISASQSSFQNGLTLLAVCVGIIAILIGLIDRIKAPAFDFTLPSQPGAIFVLIALASANLADPIFFTALFLQKQHNLVIAVTGLAMIPMNLGSAGGNLIAGPIIARIGAYRTVLTGFLISAAIALSLMSIKPETPMAVIITLLSLFLFFKMMGSPALLTTVMGLVPAQLAGVASSWRNAAQILGVAIGGVLVGSVIFNTFQESLATLLDTSALTTAQADQIANLIRHGHRELIPMDITHVHGPALHDLIHPDGPVINLAQVNGYKTLGPAMALANVIACLALWISKRSQTAARSHNQD